MIHHYVFLWMAGNYGDVVMFEMPNNASVQSPSHFGNERWNSRLQSISRYSSNPEDQFQCHSHLDPNESIA